MNKKEHRDAFSTENRLWKRDLPPALHERTLRTMKRMGCYSRGQALLMAMTDFNNKYGEPEQ